MWQRAAVGLAAQYLAWLRFDGSFASNHQQVTIANLLPAQANSASSYPQWDGK